MNERKLTSLDSALFQLNPVVIAYSGGVDSSFLVHRASLVKGLKSAAVTIKTPYVPDRELNDAVDFCKIYGIEHHIVHIEFPEAVRNNPPERCYLCKKFLFSRLKEFAAMNGYAYIADGSNADDLKSYRPGLKALAELGISSPLAESGLTKEEIRKASKDAGLPTWDNPSMACLLTRLPYNVTITEKELKMVEEAEDFLFENGLYGTRVRMYGSIARLECMPGYMEKFISGPGREFIIKKLKDIGFRYITLDLEGYRSGSMDQT